LGASKPDEQTGLSAEDAMQFGFDDAGDTWLNHVRLAGEESSWGSVGAYDVLEETSRGAQGVVYRARHRRTHELVAVKRLLAGSNDRRRFEQEIEAVRALAHPNIVTLLDRPSVDGPPVFVMRWVNGRPINEWAQEKSLSRDSLLRTFLKVCDAVSHAHGKGVLHRDLKPSNILVEPSGEPFVLDFGLARLDFAAPGRDLTISGDFVGTPAYAAPEQFRGGPEALDERCDVYALGVILYEMLTGRMPYPVHANFIRTVDAIRSQPPLRPSSVVEDLPAALEAILLCALAKDPGERYSSVAALAADLDSFLAGRPIVALLPSNLFLLRRFVRRHRLVTAMAIMIFLTTLAGATVAGWLARDADRARRSERSAREVATRINALLSDLLAAPADTPDGDTMRMIDGLETAARRVHRELDDHPELAGDLLRTIAGSYYNVGMSAQSEFHWRSAIDAYRRAGASTNERLLSCLINLGSVYCFEDREGAIPLLTEALDLSHHLHGDAHPEVVNALHGLAFAYYRSANPPRYEDAERCLQEALAVAQRLPRRDDRLVARVLYTYSAMLSRQGRHADSEATYARALAVMEHVYGRRSSVYLRCQSDYAEALTRAGRLGEAAALLDSLLEPVRETMGEQSTSSILARRGGIALAQRDARVARHSFGHALVTYLRPLAVRMAEVRPLLDYVEEWSEGSALDTRDIAELAEHLPVLEEIDPRDHSDIHTISEIMTDLADWASAGKDWPTAERLLRLAMHCEGASRPRGHWRLAPIESRLGAVIAASGKASEGMQLLRDNHALLLQQRGPAAAETVEAEERLRAFSEPTSATPYSAEVPLR
jgi:serine/threonine-protein kinase